MLARLRRLAAVDNKALAEVLHVSPKILARLSEQAGRTPGYEKWTLRLDVNAVLDVQATQEQQSGALSRCHHASGFRPQIVRFSSGKASGFERPPITT
jgi:hypothetical protein